MFSDTPSVFRFYFIFIKQLRRLASAQLEMSRLLSDSLCTGSLCFLQTAEAVPRGRVLLPNCARLIKRCDTDKKKKKKTPKVFPPLFSQPVTVCCEELDIAQTEGLTLQCQPLKIQLLEGSPPVQQQAKFLKVRIRNEAARLWPPVCFTERHP